MSLSLGNTTIGSLYLGSTKVSEAYLGSTKVYESAVHLPAYTLRYQFHTSGFDPTTLTGGKGTWTQVSAIPNVWDWTYQVVGGDTDWSFGPFATTSSGATSVHLTGTYDVIAAGDNTGVTDMQYFFGIHTAENPTGCTTNGPVSVCDLNIQPTAFNGMFRWCSTLTSFAGGIDISNLAIQYDSQSRPYLNFRDMFKGASITSLPSFTGSKTVQAGNDFTVNFQHFLSYCGSLTDISNLSTIDLRFDNLANMSPNDGIRMETMLYNTPSLTLTGNECNGWNQNAIPVRVVSDISGQGSSSYLDSNKINIFKWRLRNNAIFSYAFYSQSLTTVPDFTTFSYTGCNFTSCFANNPNVTSGALAAYTKLSSLTGTVGTGCFTDCGSNTVSGTADLDQIPQSWGGNLVVQDYYLGTSWSKAYNSSSNGTIWTFTPNIDFSDTNSFASMEIYTEASVSAYAGVNMRKTNIGYKQGTFDSTAACYYWPCLFQLDPDTPSEMTWYMRTQNYNGTLTASETQGDMPGILSVSTLGTVSPASSSMRQYYRTDRPVYFGFVVTNTASPRNADIMRNFGVLYNNNLKTDPVIRVVKSTLNPANAYIGQ